MHIPWTWAAVVFLLSTLPTAYMGRWTSKRWRSTCDPSFRRHKSLSLSQPVPKPQCKQSTPPWFFLHLRTILFTDDGSLSYSCSARSKLEGIGIIPSSCGLTRTCFDFSRACTIRLSWLTSKVRCYRLLNGLYVIIHASTPRRIVTNDPRNIHMLLLARTTDLLQCHLLTPPRHNTDVTKNCVPIKHHNTRHIA